MQQDGIWDDDFEARIKIFKKDLLSADDESAASQRKLDRLICEANVPGSGLSCGASVACLASRLLRTMTRDAPRANAAGPAGSLSCPQLPLRMWQRYGCDGVGRVALLG